MEKWAKLPFGPLRSFIVLIELNDMLTDMTYRPSSLFSYCPTNRQMGFLRASSGLTCRALKAKKPKANENESQCLMICLLTAVPMVPVEESVTPSILAPPTVVGTWGQGMCSKY